MNNRVMIRRADTRFDAENSCTAYFNGHPMHGRLIDLSQGGASFRLNFGSLDNLGNQIETLIIDGIGRFSTEKRWSAGERFGVRFIHDDETAAAVRDFLKDRRSS